MAVTLNYSWVKPTVSGDVGAWGTILNTLCDAVDADLKLRQTAAATAQTAADLAKAETLARVNAPIIGSAGQVDHLASTNFTMDLERNELTLRIPTTAPASMSAIAMFPIHGLVPGMRITGLKSRGIAPTNTFLSVGLFYQDSGGAANTISGGGSHGTSEGTVVTSGLAEDVVADRAYYFKASFSRTAGAGQAYLQFVQPVVIRP